MNEYLICLLLLLFYCNYSHFCFLSSLHQYETYFTCLDLYYTWNFCSLYFTSHYFMNSFLYFCIVFRFFLFSLE